MFHLRPVAAENEDFLYRAYPKDWTVARKPKLGPPKARREGGRAKKEGLRKGWRDKGRDRGREGRAIQHRF